MAWNNGFWQYATQKPSPNFCERPDSETAHLIVLHNISLAPFEYGTGAIEQLFTNTIDPNAHPFFSQLENVHVSSHFLIARTGQIIQFVSCDKMAYHSGISQFNGREKCNEFSIGIELEGCDFEPFTPEQYSALMNLCRAISKNYPITAVTGHQDIAPNRKTDPGHFFDWEFLRECGLPVQRSV